MFFEHFPQKWQAVVFRNYGKVSAVRIAKVLKTTEDVIHFSAQDLGLGSFSFQAEWESKGYITTVRNNWHLLSTEQLLTLLGISKSHLDDMLQNEDFLSHKLGAKPQVDEPVYLPLSKDDAEKTAKIRKLVEANIILRKSKYFDFYKKTEYDLSADNFDSGLRIVHAYCASNPDFLLTGDFSEYNEEYLNGLKSYGINGLWFHGLLAKLSDNIPDSFSDRQHKIRLKNLDSFTKYLAKYAIKAFVYLNEPRSLCTSRQDVKDYLYNSVSEIAKSAPDLGGFITITMSENQTNCYSRIQAKDITCKLCCERSPDDVTAEVNNILYKAIRNANSNARLIAWNWGWNDFMGWMAENQENAIKRLANGIDIMCVSEEALEIEKGGIKNRIIDYSVSNPGPSERTKRVWELAKKSGHNAVAKIQVANSWECASVPYLPVFGLLNRHLENISKQGIKDLMLGWTLGGALSPNLKFVKAFSDGKTLDAFYKEEYDNCAESAKKACQHFDSAFSEFPFCLSFVYNGPQNFGCANLFYKEPTGLKSTMIGYPFDDIDGWRGNYPQEVLLSQLEKLSNEWEIGVKILEEVNGGNDAFLDLRTIATATGCHFTSAYLLTAWILTKDKALLKKEFENTQKLIRLSALDSRIGFEASNHYLYNDNNLLEKLINLMYLNK